MIKLKDARKLFTLHVLEAPSDAIKSVIAHNLEVRGFADLTVSKDRPETLLLASGSVYSVIHWHDQAMTTLVWSIEGDALGELPNELDNL